VCKEENPSPFFFFFSFFLFFFSSPLPSFPDRRPSTRDGRARDPFFFFFFLPFFPSSLSSLLEGRVTGSAGTEGASAGDGRFFFFFLFFLFFFFLFPFFSYSPGGGSRDDRRTREMEEPVFFFFFFFFFSFPFLLAVHWQAAGMLVQRGGELLFFLFLFSPLPPPSLSSLPLRGVGGAADVAETDLEGGFSLSFSLSSLSSATLPAGGPNWKGEERSSPSSFLPLTSLLLSIPGVLGGRRR